ncbi:Alpha/Beta hydrolase protein [Lophiotrema nucula]|uniref:Alpha/Beta hydrolase protein n=1 Tax=Lophiotrema nucula TaxID=690887 RepID=A0A6A5Z0W4_9PLEO|nr:Alpha/Beta hydrolase protein [Lophiotrema nucula]
MVRVALEPNRTIWRPSSISLPFIAAFAPLVSGASSLHPTVSRTTTPSIDATLSVPTISTPIFDFKVSHLELLKYVNTSRLRIAYYESGPRTGPPVLLLHGWPYDILAYIAVAPALAAKGYRVLVPYLRGNGPITFLYTDTFRSGEQATLGYDIIELLDALSIPSATFAGYDWGSMGACVAAALWPEKCNVLVSVNSYQIQDLSIAWNPLDPTIESGFWYFYYFLTPRGEQALVRNPKDIARMVWTRNSPRWNVTEEELDRAAKTFENPDYVTIPKISVPSVTLDGDADGNFPATNGSGTAKYFTGIRVHRQIEGGGHDLPQEMPEAFIDAVVEVSGLRGSD